MPRPMPARHSTVLVSKPTLPPVPLFSTPVTIDGSKPPMPRFPMPPAPPTAPRPPVVAFKPLPAGVAAAMAKYPGPPLTAETPNTEVRRVTNAAAQGHHLKPLTSLTPNPNPTPTPTPRTLRECHSAPAEPATSMERKGKPLPFPIPERVRRAARETVLDEHQYTEPLMEYEQRFTTFDASSRESRLLDQPALLPVYDGQGTVHHSQEFALASQAGKCHLLANEQRQVVVNTVACALNAIWQRLCDERLQVPLLYTNLHWALAWHQNKNMYTFVRRLMTVISDCSAETLVLAIVQLQRVQSEVTIYTLHRLFVLSLMTAIKINEDFTLTNADWIAMRDVDISLSDLNALEVGFLDTLGHVIDTRPESFFAAYETMTHACNHPKCEGSCGYQRRVYSRPAAPAAPAASTPPAASAASTPAVLAPLAASAAPDSDPVEDVTMDIMDRPTTSTSISTPTPTIMDRSTTPISTPTPTPTIVDERRDSLPMPPTPQTMPTTPMSSVSVVGHPSPHLLIETD